MPNGAKSSRTPRCRSSRNLLLALLILRHRGAIDTLAKQLVAHFGAPSIEDAVAAAEEEFAFAASLCNHPLDTLIAMHRSHDGGEIREAFRTLRPKDGPKPLRAFAFLEVEGEEEPAEQVDLAALAKRDSGDK